MTGSKRSKHPSESGKTLVAPAEALYSHSASQNMIPFAGLRNPPIEPGASRKKATAPELAPLVFDWVPPAIICPNSVKAHDSPKPELAVTGYVPIG